ncbi:hypothetical protein REPUB_Repub02eG0038900 [Reevesia pubescens]
MEASVAEVSTVLSISKDMTSILLRYFRWSVTQVTDAWFSDEFKVRKKVGLLEIIDQFPDNISGVITCGICFESYSSDSLRWDKCGHPFCIDCWANYISTYVSEGAGPLMLRCPEPSCRAAICQDMFDKIATQDQKEKFSKVDASSSDVTCLCSNSFCLNCKGEAHRPLTCDIIAKWIEKTNPESLTLSRIKMCTKPCPQCNRPIEINIGCMHMTCRPPFITELRSEKEKAKESAKKYLHCCDSWEAHGVSRKRALKDLENLKIDQIKKLSEIQQLDESQLDFLEEAWQQIIECRQILRWTYAYRYFLPKREHAKMRVFRVFTRSG